jgi:hypothetical protein
MSNTELTQQRLRLLLDYNPGTGRFTWRVNRGGTAVKGSEAGAIHNKGYRSIKVDRKNYLEHRLVWLWEYGEWPSNELDHVNRIKTDNRLSNLRDVTRSENMQNTPARSNNLSGFKGVSWHDGAGSWMAGIMANGKSTYLGCFNTPEEAYAAYCAAASRLHTRNPVATS